MDWEPEIPGQFDTPLRIRRKRSAADAGFTVNGPETHPSPVVAYQPLFPQQDWFRPIAHILVTTFRIIHYLYSATARSTDRIRSRVFAVQQSRRVVEIRQTTSDGQESIKRRATDSGRVRIVAPTSQHITRSGHKARPKTTSTKSPRPVINRTISPSQDTSTRKSPTSPPECSLITPVEDSLSCEAAKQREALGASILASFTPPPLPGMVNLSEVAATPGPVLDSEDLDMLDYPAEISIVQKSFSDEPDTETPIAESLSQTQKARQTYSRPTHKLGYSTHETSSTTKPVGVLRTVRMRQSHPPSSGPNMREMFARPKSASIVSKQVRFSINPLSGLPDEQSVKFYRESIVGDWAPSSPWAEEKADSSMSNLDANLGTLMDEEMPLPPVIVPDQQGLFGELPNIAGSENAILSPEPKPAISPQDHITPQNSSRTSIYGSTIQSPCLKGLTTELAEGPARELSAGEIPQVLPANGSPYLRVKNLLASLFRSPIGLRRADVDPRTIQRSVDASIDVLDESHDGPHSQLPSFGTSKTGETQQVEEERFSVSRGAISTPSTLVRPTSRKGSKTAANGSSGHSDDLNVNPEDKVEVMLNKSDHRFLEQLDGITVTGSVTASSENEGIADKLDQLKLSGPRGKLEMSRLMKEKRCILKKEREMARAAEQAAAAKAKAEEAERRAQSHRRMPKQKLVQPLSKDWEAKIEESMHKGDHTAVTTTVSGTEIRRKDLMTVLGEREWLNDEIINAYIDWIVEYSNEKAGKNGRTAIPKVIAHSSFFYNNLATKGPNSVSRWMKRKRAEGKKLLEVETILIPVNNASHWTMIVVSPKSRTIEYLDSFSGSAGTFVKNTKDWLAAELGDGWHENEWKVLDTRSAEQLNGYDCGVFAITNAECVAGGVDTNSYDWADMAAQRRRIAGVLLNRGFGGDFIPAEEL